MRLLRLVVSALLVPCLSAGASATEPAATGRLVLGTHDATLAAALSVAVSPRGLSVVELPEPLARTSDLEDARRELAAQDGVAIVWLCDDDAGAHALCFCARDGRFVARPLGIAAPLAAPDAAAVALTVKVLLGPPAPPAAPSPSAPPAPAPGSPPSAATAERGPAWTLPKVTAELVGGVRVQGDESNPAPRFGFTAVFAPDRLERRLGLGLGVTAGPRQIVSDLALRVHARGRLPVQPFWLDLDLGPSAHLLSFDLGTPPTSRTQLSLDALGGFILPLGPYFVGVRAGAILVPSPATDAPPSLPRWSGEVQLTFGANVL